MAAKKKAENEGKRGFIRRQLTENKDITNDQIISNWKAAFRGSDLTERAVRRERTLFKALTAYDEQEGLEEFFSSQADLLLAQYHNIEHLLGPTDSDWSWPGEHCEVLLREAIERHLPPPLRAGKGYIYGLRKKEKQILRSPEVDIIIYNAELFAPLFTLGQFVIVRPESVVAAIQVKRTLDAATLKHAVDNVVAAKEHVRDTCRFNGSAITEQMFSAVVSFEDKIPVKGKGGLSDSYETALQPHISEFHHGFVLPDFVGSLTGTFLHFTGLNSQEMRFQAFPSVQNKRNVALPFLLFMLMRKIRPFGVGLPPAFPEDLKLLDSLLMWKA